MNISVLSTDPELVSMCRDVVDLPALGRCVWHPLTDIDCMPRDGLKIFDLPDSPAGGALLDHMEQDTDSGPRIVLVDRNALARFRARILLSGATVVLKPLTRVRLEIAIEQVMGSTSHSLNEPLLRHGRNELLRHLLEANLRLQEHDQDRTNFLARSVHELRAPLTSLNGYCDLLLERRLGPLSAQQDTVISRMRHSLTRLSRIVTSMFQLSVGETGAEQPRLSPGNYLGCIEQAIHELVPLFEERQIELMVNLDPPAGVVEFDPSQMEQVVINVLDNSCKFTPRGGVVRIAGFPYVWNHQLRPEKKGLNGAPCNAYRLDIADNGPGVPPEHITRIFEEYAAFGDGEDRSGVGLGLAICRMIVSRHRGSIWAESNGTGATFSIVLPCR